VNLSATHPLLSSSAASANIIDKLILVKEIRKAANLALPCEPRGLRGHII